MIKVVVLLYGLVMFVPINEVPDTLEAEQLSVLVFNGEVAGEHEPGARWVDGVFQRGPDWNLDPGFVIQIDGPGGLVDLDARGFFPQLETLFSNPIHGKIPSSCVEGPTSCPAPPGLVAGRVKIRGYWDAKPATFCNHDWNRPVAFDDEAQSQYRQAPDGDPRYPESQPLATGLWLETMIPEDMLDRLIEVTSGSSMKPTILDPRICRIWTGDARYPCAILEIGSPATGATGCNEPECRLDRHFSAFHLLASMPSALPWLPYVVGDTECPMGYPIPNKPAVRCPPTFATVEEAAAPR